MSVVLAGGGTAGHIEPALALADALRRVDPRIPITCLGTERGLETRLVPLRGYDLALIPAVPLPRSLTPQLLSVPGRLAGAMNATAAASGPGRADVLVGFGGYVATPAYLAARRRGVPIVVHEANPRPGLANRIGARLTEHVFTGQPGTKLPHATVHRHPDPAGDRRAGPAGAGRQGPGALRAPARPARAAGHRRLPGRPLAQPGACSPRRAGPRPGSRCCTSSAPHGTSRSRRPAAMRRTSCCRTWTGWTWRYAAADFALCRAAR